MGVAVPETAEDVQTLSGVPEEVDIGTSITQFGCWPSSRARRGGIPVTIIAAYFVVLFSLLIVFSCLWGLIRPQWLFDIAKPLLDQSWLMILAVSIRILLGIALLRVADASAFPLLFYVIGWIAIVAAVALPFIGIECIRALIDWIETLPRIFLRLWLVFGLAFGGLLLFGVHSVLI